MNTKFDKHPRMVSLSVNHRRAPSLPQTARDHAPRFPAIFLSDSPCLPRCDVSISRPAKNRTFFLACSFLSILNPYLTVVVAVVVVVGCDVDLTLFASCYMLPVVLGLRYRIAEKKGWAFVRSTVVEHCFNFHLRALSNFVMP